MNIKAKASTKGVVFGAKVQTEVILNKGANMLLVFTLMAVTQPQETRVAKPRVVLDVETY